jgi:hypothetical protein
MQKEVGGMMGGRLQMQRWDVLLCGRYLFCPGTALHFGVGEEENLVFHS